MSNEQSPGWSLPHIGINHAIAGLPLGSIKARDEYLHAPPASNHYSSTETSYFGFNIPEQKLNAEVYLWFHPVLRVMSASAYIWRGLKTSTLACDYVNHHHFLPFPESDIDGYEIPDTGLRIKVIEPLKSVQVDLLDKERNVSFSFLSEAIMPPGVRPGNFHFTQAMKTTGELNLFGSRYVIDGYFSRDRSWGQERHERDLRIPPLSWTVGVFNSNFAFHVLGFESPQSGPSWVGRYPIKIGQNLIWGYVFRDGSTYPVTQLSQLTTREPDGLSPRLIELELVDAGCQVHGLRGYVNARLPWQEWKQMNVWFCQVRWEGRRGIGWGDFHDVQYGDFVSHFGRG